MVSRVECVVSLPPHIRAEVQQILDAEARRLLDEQKKNHEPDMAPPAAIEAVARVFVKILQERYPGTSWVVRDPE